MSRIKETLETLFNSIAPIYSNITLKIIEQPIPVDINLIGTARFARKIGSIISFIEPQNEMISSEPSVQNDMKMKVETSIHWFDNWAVPGQDGRLLRSIIRIGNEYNKLDYFDSPNKTIHFMEGLLKNYDKGTGIDLYGFPLVVSLKKISSPEGYFWNYWIPFDNSNNIGDMPFIDLVTTESYVLDDYVIEIRSKYPIMNNDVILLEWQSQAISFSEYKILVAYFKGKTTEGLYRYYVDIENSRDFKAKLIKNENSNLTEIQIDIFNSLIYVQGFPAYESRIFKAPLLQGKTTIGLFCVDFMSGALYAYTTPIEDFMNIKLKTSSGNYIHYGTNDSYKTISKNTSIPNCITSDRIILWDVVEGNINVEAPDKILLIPNCEGKTCIKFDTAPPINTPGKWKCKFYTDSRESEIDLSIELYPNEIMRYKIPYQVSGYEIYIEAINSNVSVKGIITDINSKPTIVSPEDTYIVEDVTNAYYGLAKYIGQQDLGGYWYLYKPNFGATYYYNGNYYRFSKYAGVGHWRIVDNGYNIEKIIVATKSNYPVKMNSWVSSDNQVSDIEYQIVSHVFGLNWQGSSLILKPLMKSLYNLEGTYREAEYNNGYIYNRR